MLMWVLGHSNPGEGWTRPLLLARSLSTSVYSHTETLNQVSLISDQSSLIYYFWHLCNVSQNYLSAGENEVLYWTIKSDLLLGFTRLVTRVFFCLPVIKTFAHIQQLRQQPLRLYQQLLGHLLCLHPWCVLFIMHPWHSLYICCLTLCLCTTSLNIHTNSHSQS